MTCHFEAKVNQIPCRIYLNDEWRIYDVLLAEQPWRIADDNDLYAKLEDQYGYLIDACRKEDEIEGVDYDKHIKSLRNMGHYV